MGGYEKSAGRFKLVAWLDGFPVSMDLTHEELNGSEAKIRLFGIEELHDLKFVVERAIQNIESITPNR